MLDIVLALLDQSEDQNCAVSHLAHATGALVGMLVAMACLKTFKSCDITEAIQKGCRGLLVGVCLLLMWWCLGEAGGTVQNKIGR